MTLVFVLFLFIFSSLDAQYSDDTTLSNRWIVELSEESYEAFDTDQLKSTIQLRKISDHFHLINVISEAQLPQSYVQDLFSDYSILAIRVDQKLTQRDRIPDDFKYENQWNMDLIQMPAVWDHFTGGLTPNQEEIVVAVLDVGFQIDHNDLEDNIWENKNEIIGDGIDNDANGIKDDYYGLNVDSMNDTHNVDDHGTKVAGIVGAKGNNGIGVTGVNWDVKIMPISGVDFVGEIIAAMQYVIQMKQRYISTNGAEGANIVATNLSAGVPYVFPATHPDWCPYYDLAGEVGILSVGAAPNLAINVDTEGDLPSLCQSDYLIAVTNTDQNDFRVAAAGVGPENIDLAAPGELVFTTTVGDDYSTIRGSSASAPHVAGLIALMYSLDCDKLVETAKTSPSSAALIIKEAILSGTEQLEGLEQTVTGGRLNAFNTFLEIVGWCTGNVLSSLELREVVSDEAGLDIRYSTDDFSKHTISLYNMLGQRVYTKEFQPSLFSDKVFRLELNDIELANGNYLVTLSNDQEVTSTKITFVATKD